MKIAESLSVNVMVLVWEKSAEKNSENINDLMDAEAYKALVNE